jgi:hypothetical protein
MRSYLLSLVLCIFCTTTFAQNLDNDKDYKDFLAAFPKLTLPLSLQPKDLTGAKNIAHLNHTKKLYSVTNEHFYGIGTIKDCDTRKTLLAAIVSDDPYRARQIIFYVITLENGLLRNAVKALNGSFTEENGSFCSNCFVIIESNGKTSITTNQNGNKLTIVANACD